MKFRHSFRWAPFAALLALGAPAAPAQKVNPRLSPDKVVAKGVLTSVKAEKRKQVVNVSAKSLNVDPASLTVSPGALKSALTPDLTVSNAYQVATSADQKPHHYVVVENKGQVASGPCVLRFMYGDTLDALESTDYDIKALAPHASVNIEFTPPAKDVHWWLFGADVDNKLKEADLSNNVYLIEFKTAPKEPEIK